MGNLADALLLASIAGPGSDLEKSTVKRYLESQIDRSFMRVATAVVEKDLGALVRGIHSTPPPFGRYVYVVFDVCV